MLGPGGTPSNDDQWGGADYSASAVGAEPAQAKSGVGKIIALLAAAIVVLAAAGAGVWALTKDEDAAGVATIANEAETAASQPSSSSAPTTTDKKVVEEAETSDEAVPTTKEKVTAESPQLGDCDPNSAGQDGNRYVSLYCDGRWHFLGKSQSGVFSLAHWSDGSWSGYRYDGKQGWPLTIYCYDEDKLANAGAPQELIGKLRGYQMICGDEGSQEDSNHSADSSDSDNNSKTEDHHSGDWLPVPSCAGEYVLIVDSVLVYPGDNPQDLVQASLDAHPGSTSTYPGVCGAFRAKAEGANVYPVYIEYGTNLSGVCAAEARGEGFARKLTQAADYSSPC
ncbi:hypothetical protein H0194_08615 [Corynebacterium incognita]|uniref:Uncharacterized protein n=1 Tax=Corynebacterium incognita TaxID=2754725 RepID=A0A7G7CNF4_9CORY|nr:hypothetical protein [Corynebacterium incognita]QNE89120.1 hypothetical protein H0194_08615 [Corynebacterium incognita]